MKNIKYLETKIGKIELQEENGYIIEININKEKNQNEEMQVKNSKILEEAEKQLKEYFSGKRKQFEIPVNPKGTEFMKRVWQELQKIPYGETRTYKEIASKVGCEKGARAVGMANNKNPIPIIIPCHRVIGTNGKLVGYALGLEMKEQLLELEKNYKSR